MKPCYMKWKSLFAQHVNGKCFLSSLIANTMKQFKLGQLCFQHKPIYRLYCSHATFYDGIQKILNRVLLNRNITRPINFKQYAHWKYFNRMGSYTFPRFQNNLPFKSIAYQSKYRSYMFAAAVCSFSWEENGISTKEMAEWVYWISFNLLFIILCTYCSKYR